MKLTALIPVYNDDYALGFCLASIVEHFDEIVILDDASTDDTPDVAMDFARRYRAVRYCRHEGRQLGWIEARNRLLSMTESDHLFWLDSDDVLCEYNAGLLREIADGAAPIVRLQLCEMWGDFYHTTQRLRHYDRCHVYVNRRVMNDLTWTGGTCARMTHQPSTMNHQPSGRRMHDSRPSRREPGLGAPAINHSVSARNGPGPLFFHIKGVKPDRRIAERHFIRKYLGAKDRPDNLSDFVGAGLAVPVKDMTDEEIHKIALNVLLHSRQDKLTPTYLESSSMNHQPSTIPRRPKVIASASPERFRIIYYDGKIGRNSLGVGTPTDRVDRATHSPYLR